MLAKGVAFLKVQIRNHHPRRTKSKQKISQWKQDFGFKTFPHFIASLCFQILFLASLGQHPPCTDKSNTVGWIIHLGAWIFREKSHGTRMPTRVHVQVTVERHLVERWGTTGGAEYARPHVFFTPGESEQATLVFPKFQSQTSKALCRLCLCAAGPLSVTGVWAESMESWALWMVKKDLGKYPVQRPHLTGDRWRTQVTLGLFLPSPLSTFPFFRGHLPLYHGSPIRNQHLKNDLYRLETSFSHSSIGMNKEVSLGKVTRSLSFRSTMQILVSTHVHRDLIERQPKGEKKTERWRSRKAVDEEERQEDREAETQSP